MISREITYTTELGNYDKVINYLKIRINDKLNSISYRQPNRIKRGIFNELGTFAKSITGNLDDNDGQKFDKILQLLQSNQNNLEKQIELQYTISNNIIQNFNNTIKNIAHNEGLIQNRINELSDIIEEEFETADTLITKDLFNQLTILYNTLLNILQDIENSLTFCYLKTYHPSILSTDDLYRELEKISEHYGRQLPLELKIENIPAFQRLLSINCKIEKKKIIYLISIPINFETDFELFYLFPIPSKTTHGYVTILPNNKYFLKSNQIVKSLDSSCIQDTVFQCPSTSLNNYADECEIKLLQNEDTSQCQYVNLEIPNNHVEVVPEINQLLIVFPQEDLVKIQCPNDIESKILEGIFLIEKNDCKILFKNNVIEFEVKSNAKPIFMDQLNIIDHKITNSRSKIVLRNLKLNEISPNQLQPIEDESNIVNSIISLVFKFLSFTSSLTLIGYILFLVIKKIKMIRKHSIPSEASKAYPDIEVFQSNVST